MDYVYIYYGELPTSLIRTAAKWELIVADPPAMDSDTEVELSGQVSRLELIPDLVVPVHTYRFMEMEGGNALEIYIEDNRYLHLISREDEMDQVVLNWLRQNKIDL
jgi:hypothetical protein